MPAFESIADDPRKILHFVGAGGTGMSALAQFRVLKGGRASGSDRSFDRGEQAAERQRLELLGVEIVPQDGAGAERADAVVASSAVEAAIPDLAVARARGLPVLHRAQYLARLARGDSVAVAGSSGKSTVAAMLFEILKEAGRDPSLVSGGRLLSLMKDGAIGNAALGRGPLVFEADESDGSLVRYAPAAGLLLNLHHDHMEEEKLRAQFRAFKRGTRGEFLVSDDAALREFRDGARVFGFGAEANADLRGTALAAGPERSRFRLGGEEFVVPVPGAHNAWNALAAAAAARALGVPLGTAARALAGFAGVHRRFEVVGRRRGVEVVDDFAHNPAKIRAVLALAASRAQRLAVIFQPHGFAPTRFQRTELVAAFAAGLRPADRLFLAPIYFAGGTAARDISAEDLVRDLATRGAPVQHAPDRERLAGALAAAARAGDLLLVLGARDPTLPEFARDLYHRL